MAELQAGALGMLGFDAGRVDGIFGPQTEALRDFQRNAGLTTDGVWCGDVSPASSTSAGRRGSTNVAGVRERETLRSQPPVLSGRRIVVGEAGGLDVLASALDRLLQDAGAVVAVLHHPHPSVQAVKADDFGADLYIGLALTDESSEAAYYCTAGFESAGGRQLAALMVDELLALPELQIAPPSVAGSRSCVRPGCRRWCASSVRRP